MVVSLALVMGGAAAGLRVLDALPALVTGEARDRGRFESVDEVERAVHGRLLLPAYFPDRLRWPPETIRLHDGQPPSVTVEITDHVGIPALVVWQGLGLTDAVPEHLPAFTRILSVTTVRVGEDRADLVRAICADGRIWLDLRWEVDGRSLLVRSRGSVEELLRIAGSIRRRA
jgi:hypothetical protein